MSPVGRKAIRPAFAALLGAAAVVALMHSEAVMACYCTDKPFPEVVRDSDLVFIGVVTETRTWLTPEKDACCEGEIRWSATLAVNEFVKGHTSTTPVVVGGGSTSCDVDAAILRVGGLYAIAVDTRVNKAQPYRIGLCKRSWISVRSSRGAGEVSVDHVRAYARRKPGK